MLLIEAGVLAGMPYPHHPYLIFRHKIADTKPVKFKGTVVVVGVVAFVFVRSILPRVFKYVPHF